MEKCYFLLSCRLQRFSNYANGTTSRKASHLILFSGIYPPTLACVVIVLISFLSRCGHFFREWGDDTVCQFYSQHVCFKLLFLFIWKTKISYKYSHPCMFVISVC